MGTQEVMISVPVVAGLMVKFNVTMLSQPVALVRVWVAVVLLVLYVFPSIHVMGVQEVMMSVPVVAGLMVKFSVTILSQPLAAPPTRV